MREILFRGKRKDNGEWVQGSLHTEYGETTQDGNREIDYRILGMRGECNYVIAETVGQYTGLTDKNGKKIFEGDILKPFNNEIIVVSYIEHLMCLGLMIHTTIKGKKRGKEKTSISSGWCFLFDYNLNELEVIGNIHDNPELLRGKTND